MAATKLDSRTDIYRGQLFLFDGSGNPLAFATTATMEVTTEEIDISNKMMGGWSGSLPGRKSYTMSSEALVTKKQGAFSYQTLLNAQITDSTLGFQLAEATCADQDNFGGTFNPDEDNDYYSGEVMITSLSLTSEQGNIAKLSVSFKGIGGLSVNGEVPEGSGGGSTGGGTGGGGGDDGQGTFG